MNAQNLLGVGIEGVGWARIHGGAQSQEKKEGTGLELLRMGLCAK